MNNASNAIQYVSDLGIWSINTIIQYLFNILLAFINSILSLDLSTKADSLWISLIWLGDHGILAVIISLLLTALIFWWANIRHGMLIVDFPKNISIWVRNDEGISSIKTKVLLYNTGMPDIIIRDSRIIIEQANRSSSFWCAIADNKFRSELIIILKGHRGYLPYFEFNREKGLSPMFLENGDCTLKLGFKLQHRSDWVQHVSRAKVFASYPKEAYEGREGYYLSLELLDQPTALNKISEVREGRWQ